jgi:hypothetical protein
MPSHSLPLWRVGLVACGKRKLKHRAKAEDLYTSPGFRLARRYCELSCDQWAILSAKHGLVLPDEMIDPYDKRLQNMPAAERRLWQGFVAGEVVSWLAGFAPSRVEIVLLAGKDYRAGFESPQFRSVYPHVIAPMAGLGMFKQHAWLRMENEKLGALSLRKGVGKP